MLNIETEQNQLIATWTKALSSDWMNKPRAPIRALIDPAITVFGSHLRQGHNIFGWKAGDTLKQHGLCSGAIYRTERFMEIPQDARCGSKIDAGNIHIEHTVPVATLNREWALYRKSNAAPTLTRAYAWLLTHSVLTAFHLSEKGNIKGYERKTEALNPSSDWFDRPFVRYNMMADVPVVWNVVNGQRIDPLTWSFADHFSSISKLLDLSGNAADAEAVKAEALPFLDSFQQREWIAA
jgi:hypothetical protein